MRKPTLQLTPELAAAAERLIEATRSGHPTGPVRDAMAPGDIDAAYAIQTAVIAGAYANDSVVGRKIGLTSAAVQTQLGVDQPDFGVLFASMNVPDGSGLSSDRFVEPRVEGEIAFRLGADLDTENPEDLTLDKVRSAIGAAAASIEICDSRIAGWDITIVDTVADNASAAGFVTGPWHSFAELTAQGWEARDSSMSMSINGEVVATGAGDACLGDPLNAVLWLAREAARYGAPLQAGQVVLSGALAPMLPFDPGQTVELTIRGLGSASVTRERM